MNKNINYYLELFNELVEKTYFKKESNTYSDEQVNKIIKLIEYMLTKGKSCVIRKNIRLILDFSFLVDEIKQININQYPFFLSIDYELFREIFNLLFCYSCYCSKNSIRFIILFSKNSTEIRLEIVEDERFFQFTIEYNIKSREHRFIFLNDEYPCKNVKRIINKAKLLQMLKKILDFHWNNIFIISDNVVFKKYYDYIDGILKNKRYEKSFLFPLCEVEDSAQIKEYKINDTNTKR